MKILKLSAVAALGLLVVSTQAYAQTCTSPADGTGLVQSFRAAIGTGSNGAGDFFGCASPATCTLSYRTYWEAESSCINAEQAFTGDYLPAVFGKQNNKYESDIHVASNWPPGLGKEGTAWFILWDYLARPGSADCAGYYAAQSDLVNRELGAYRSTPCDCTTVGGGCSSLSCADFLRPADDVCPDVNTPRIETRYGALVPVPTPVIAGVNPPGGTDFAAGGAVDLSWVGACLIGGSADNPPSAGMGYRVEARVDANGNGQCDGPIACDVDSTDEWFPVLDIAPTPHLATDPILDATGDITTTGASIPFADLQVGTAAPISTWECVQYRLRILYRDDRFTTPVAGGFVGGINPVTSLPSGPSALVANQALAALISSFVGVAERGNRVDLSWRVSNDSFTLFSVSKSDSRNGTFRSVGEVRGVPGQLTYGLTDSQARSGGAGRGNAIWYRLVASGPGSTEEAFVAVPVERGKGRNK